MNRRFLSICAFLILASSGSKRATADLLKLDFSTIDFPGSQSTTANSFFRNDVIGNYKDGSGISHGFFYVGTTYMTLEPPGATSSTARASGGFVLGTYSAPGVPAGNFLFDGSHFTIINVPGAVSATLKSADSTDVVGNFSDGSRTHGFVYDGSTYRTIDFPGSTSTSADFVSGNRIAGTYTDAGGSHAFFFDGSSYTTIAFPGGTDTRIVGLAGQFVFGNAFSFVGAFTYDGTSYSLVDPFGLGPFGVPIEAIGTSGSNMLVQYALDPGGFGVIFDGVNATDVQAPVQDGTSFVSTISGNSVGGRAFEPDRAHPFLYDDGAYYDADPGFDATVTAVSGDRIILDGDILGQPTPEPGTLVLMALGGAGVIGSQWARRRRGLLR
jgi:hypothetical protein